MLQDDVVIFTASTTPRLVRAQIPDSDSTLYWYSYVPFVPENPIQINTGTYEFKIEYGTSVSTNFIGWIQQHEDIQSVMSYTPEDDEQNPLTIRFKTMNEGVL